MAGATPRRSARRGKKAQQDDEVPAVFQEMLREEQASNDARPDEDERPSKKRKTAPSHAQPRLQSEPEPQRTATTQPTGEDHVRASRRVRQTIIDSDESDDSDMEWEDALADGDDTDDPEQGGDITPQIGDISITMGAKKTDDAGPKRKIRRRAITSVDKRRRLDIHKMHLLCLLSHVHRRNAWCNDRRVQSTLRKIIPSRTLSNLVPNPDLTQYSASKHFMDGMNELKILWSKRFKITAQGMYKPRWAEAEAAIRPFSDFDDMDDPMDKDDFRTAAHTLQASQDVGAQLFCALLRGIGIETRLVCSLQPLPFASAAERATPQKTSAQKNTIVVDPYNKPVELSPTKSKSQGPRNKKLSRLERVMGERHAVLNQTGVAPKKQKAYHTPYPVYWVETFNPFYQKWVTIDTHSTFTVNSPEKLEPPLSFTQNSLSYAIAFEDDYAARDVTRRYAKAYNAKTRKCRVESTPDGAKWWKRTMKFFERASMLDRDQMEDASLARKEAAEGIPRNVQDFKGHPVYVLERHLRHNEVIHPRNQVGKVNCGTAMNPKMEPIYRRSNVYLVRSADKWYRIGRDVKFGEQPLKRAKPKKGRRSSIGAEMDAEDGMEEVGAGLFAEFQTEIYVPPPVFRGRVPRNVYGNLDLYVPSMCPPGGTHIRHKLASKAARIVGVDFADAVTGFSFKGRHGTAIVQGVVVAQEYAEAVQAVIEGMENQQEEAETAARRTESLRLWRRFFLGLRIAQRVNAIEIDGEKGPAIDVQDEISKEDRELAAQEMAGGFFPDEGEVAEPSGGGYQPPPQDYGGGGGFLPTNDIIDDGDGGGFFPDESTDAAPISLHRHQSFESSILDSQQLRPRRKNSFGQIYSSEDDEEGGGFVPEDYVDEAGPSNIAEDAAATMPSQHNGAADDTAGGFVPDAAQPPNEEPQQNTTPPEHVKTQTKSEEDAQMDSPPSSPSEAGSLLLEDPEDEDADPDWLVDAT
ncbi:DNA repair protein Rhp41 [Stemphylium lycopersici]|uniref:DNA repair protein Rhp41 n=1 Tax=Stemphylium lycopersici TaxID=183478 RepID=A0A364N2W0_STELY|nr:dna repair protein [Stemphylium lycopersici]RAR05602.1 DNA repair protein Rhp41 [Stemphylium lycopersici]RAR10286.1 DNA repair protein Rhp41 [Stemphylium lycopersici]